MIKFLLILLTILSATWIYIFSYHFETLPEPWEGAEELGPIFYDLSIAYIAALIFYLIVVFLKQKQDGKNINPYISRKVKKINNEIDNLIKDLTDSSGVKTESDYPTDEELIKICDKIDANKKVQFNRAYLRDILDYSSWWKYLNSYNQEIQKTITQILNKSQYLENDTRLIKIISDIEDCIYIEKIKLESEKNIKSPIKLSIIKPQLQHFLNLAEKLKKYSQSYLKKYKNDRK